MNFKFETIFTNKRNPGKIRYDYLQKMNCKKLVTITKSITYEKAFRQNAK